jgi:3-oxoacyl-[acyl-carrier protein] reductase
MGYNCPAPTQEGDDVADPATREQGAAVPTRVRVVGSGPLAAELAAALGERGCEVIGADDSGEGLDAVVFAPWDPTVVRPVPFDELTDDDFDRAWQQTMDAAVATCIEARHDFAGRGGRIVLTTPTTAFVGGAEYGHWAAAAEGVRILAKSAARQWGPEGIAVNALAVAPERVLADAAVAGPVSIAAPAIPVARPGDVLSFLCSPSAAALAGQTLTVDGGLWM